MKRVILSGIFALCTMGIFAQTNTNSLPSTAQEYIQQNFSSADVKEVKENSKWKIWEDEKFEVVLSNGLELDFDENGNISEIESQTDVVIPTSALPSKMASYLQENYADAQVIGWEKQKKEQEIELADGTELEFDGEGNFRKVD
jgi:hypothetical protein